MFADLLFGRMPTLPKGRLRIIKETPPTYNGGPDEPSARKHGERQRERIMQLIDECHGITLPILASEMNLSPNCLRRHLDKLQAEGQVDRHEPEQRGTGFFLTWTRRDNAGGNRRMTAALSPAGVRVDRRVIRRPASADF